MGDVKGFLKVKRQVFKYRPVCERIKDYREVCVLPRIEHSKEQASRCMDCGTPFCHWGCPIGNYIPEWNDLMFRGLWEKAFSLLNATNNLPEITGRICPATCEYSCVLGINDDPVTIKENELAIIEYAFKKGLIKPRPAKKRTGKKIAIIGSGPAGLACADQLNKAGHHVVVFEKDDLPGGILRYGIPDFKLEKRVLDRRLKILEKEGVKFKTNVFAGIDGSAAELTKEFDAVCLACGCRVPRDLKIEGRGLEGIYFALDYLTQSNKRIAGARHKTSAGIRQSNVADEKFASNQLIDAKGKQVVVIGGGDTGADCVGVAHRQQASCVVQIEIMPSPPECRSQDSPWPKYPLLLKASTSHEEGGKRDWTVLTKKFLGEKGEVKKLSCIRVDGSTSLTINPERAKRVERIEFPAKDAKGCPIMREIPGSEFEIEADLVILALGFLHPDKKGLIADLHLDLDSRGNVKTDENFMTSKKGVFSCGDMHRGQSLIVWAISEGRKAAYHIDKYLMGKSYLPMI